MTRLCPACSHVLPAGIRVGFCPRCSLADAADLRDGDAFAAPGEYHRVGDYELEELLGRGGMGLVYRARQRGLDRPVALKLLAAGEFADASARKRFQAEAGAVARLRHPNIVAVHEVGEHHGQPFFSMELVDGKTFADLTRDGPVSPLQAARLLQPVARAVHYAHEQGVLHRDLKPSNLLLDAFEHPKVSDFGLARRLDGAERLTLSGEVLGSPSYLAPEQARGDREMESPATDVYALGAILYQMLTGRPPHAGHSPAAVLRQVIEREPVAPREINPLVPQDIETICLKCLAKEPRQRYATAAEFADELARFEHGESLLARPLGPGARAVRWARRRPALAIAAAALAVAFLTLAIVPTAAFIRVRKAEAERAAQLRETLLNEARALRLGGRSGQHRESWAALQRASSMGGNRNAPLLARSSEYAGHAHSFESRLREEAIATLALDDAWIEPVTNAPPERDPTYLTFDASQQSFAHGSFQGPLKVGGRSASATQEISMGGRSLQHVLAFSPWGRFLAVRHGGSIAIWDLTNRVVTAEQRCWLNQYSFHPGQSAVAFMRTNGRIACVSLPGGALLWEFPAGPASDAAIAFAPNGTSIAVGAGGQGGVEIRQAPAGQLLLSLAMPEVARALAWSSDARWVAAGSSDGRVRIWDLTSGPMTARKPSLPPAPLEPTWLFEGHTESVRALAFSPSGRWVASSGADDTVRLFDTRTGRAALTFPAEAFQFTFASEVVAPKGRSTPAEIAPPLLRLGPVWQGGRPVWIRLAESEVFHSMRLPAFAGLTPALALDHAGARLAAATKRHLLLYDTSFQHVPARFPFSDARAASFLGGKILLGLSYRQTVLWDESGQTSQYVPGGGEVASFSANGAIMALADYPANTVTVFTNRLPLHRLRHFRVACVAVDAEGKRIVSTSLDQGDTRLWNALTGQQLNTWADDGANRVVFSPDGRWLAQFGARCAIWDTRDWSKRILQPEFPVNSGAVDAAFSADGATFAAIIADREIHLFRVPAFNHIATLQAPSGRLHRLAWSGDGARLAATAAQNEILIWHLPPLRTHLRSLGADW